MQQDPIYELEGTQLKDGWVVGKQFQPRPDGTGGAFSVSYRAKNGEIEGFLKAFDFRLGSDVVDKARALQHMSNMYVFERDLLDLCRDRRIRKVVTSVSYGEITADRAPLGVIFYIIFELADGDSRAQQSMAQHRDYEWCYRALHHMAIALQGLHGNEVYHQDVKPSNVLVFNNGLENKLSDFGRSHANTLNSPIASLYTPGDLKYSPPEQLYKYCPAEDREKRVCGDLYLLGSMIFFFFTGNMLTPVMLSRMAEEHRPLNRRTGVGWTGDSAQVLPYLQAAYGEAVAMLEECLRAEVPERLQQKLIPDTLAVFKMLTDPVPGKRGHKVNRARKNEDSLALNRFVSVFDRLALTATLMKHRDAKDTRQRPSQTASALASS